MQACWAEEEAARPRFEDVVVALDEMRAIDCAKPRWGDGSGSSGQGGAWQAVIVLLLLPHIEVRACITGIVASCQLLVACC